jgi:hypothetical protein
VTVSDLLTKLNGRTPRFVTISGLVVGSANVTKESNGYLHVEHGRVTPIMKHTFHGGDDPVSPDDVEPWWLSTPWAIALERSNVAFAFPGFVDVAIAGVPGWVGQIDTGHGKFQIEVLHRPDHGLPMIEVLKPARLERPRGRRMVSSPHRYRSGLLCVADTIDWKPAEHDAVVAIAWAAHWLAAYTLWRANLQWPWAGVDVQAV